MVLDPANGVAKGEGGCLLLQHVRSSAVEEHDWEALVHSCENGGEHRPVVECNRHNWCSIGVTTSFPKCLEIETAPFFCLYPVYYVLKTLAFLLEHVCGIYKKGHIYLNNNIIWFVRTCRGTNNWHCRHWAADGTVKLRLSVTRLPHSFH